MSGLIQVANGFCFGTGAILAAAALKALFGFHFC